jgi:hypothetical protein
MALNTKFGSTLLSSFFPIGVPAIENPPPQKNLLKKYFKKKKQGVSHNVALPFTLKRILRHKKNYGNSNTFHRAKI